MNIGNLIPLATALSLITSFLIPYLSALVTRYNGWWTGFCTIFLSAASAFISEWAAAGGNFDWKHGLLTMIVNVFIAWGTHHKWLAGTELERKLLAFPKPRPVAPPQQQAA